MELDTSVPKWLTDSVQWYSSAERIQQEEKFKLGMEQGKANLASSLLGLQQQQFGLDLNKINAQRLSEDLSTLPQWMAEHPSWESRQGAQWPVPKSPQGASILENMRLRDAASIQHSVAVDAIHDFAKRVDKLRELDPQAAGQFAPAMGQLPTPQALQSLSLAEQALEAKRKSERDQAEKAAIARGDIPTTEITDKGVVRTYKPAKEVRPEDAQYETPFPEMPWIRTIRTANGAVHVVRGQAPMTPQQRADILGKVQDVELSMRLSRDENAKGFYRQQIDVLKQSLESPPSGASTAPANPNIPQPAIDYLKAHPELRGDFDKKYGAGASSTILGQ